MKPASMSAPIPVVPVILSGGFGTRLWPASRKRQPKHLLPLREERTMFRLTVERTRGLPGVTAPLVACNEDHRPGIQRDLHRAGYDDATIILEPVGRNTAPAVATAALHLAQRYGQAIMLVLPADHVVADEESFARAVSVAVPQAEAGYLVTFGIAPTHPATGYGYIRTGEKISPSVRAVARFVEKPKRAVASRFLRSGGYLWNSGMFVFSSGALIEEMARHAPDVLAACRAALAAAERRNGLILLDEAAFASAPAISVDYAVMERTARAAVVGLDAGWSDVGDWAALWDLADQDADGNAISGDVMALGVHRLAPAGVQPPGGGDRPRRCRRGGDRRCRAGRGPRSRPGGQDPGGASPGGGPARVRVRRHRLAHLGHFDHGAPRRRHHRPPGDGRPGERGPFRRPRHPALHRDSRPGPPHPGDQRSQPGAG